MHDHKHFVTAGQCAVNALTKGSCSCDICPALASMLVQCTFPNKCECVCEQCDHIKLEAAENKCFVVVAKMSVMLHMRLDQT